MVDVLNLGVPQVANRAFVALAIEAGIEASIKSLVGLAIDKHTLLIELKEALWESNEPLARALNIQTLDALMEYLSTKDSSAVVDATALPLLLDEDGPVSVAAGWDANPGQLNITYNAPPEEYTAEIYLDGVFAKHSVLTGSGGWVNEALINVPAGAHTVRVLYRNSDGNITRFGQMASIS